MQDYFRVGVITSTHGIRGEVKIYATTDDIRRFKKLKKCIIDTGREQIPLEVEGCKFVKQIPVLKFRDLDSINDVEQYKGKDLLVSRQDAIPLGKDEYFIADLIGLAVYTDEGRLLGKVADVLETGANDVFAVDSLEYGEVLIPYIESCVKKISLEEGRMDICLLDGLLDLNQKSKK